MNTFDDIDDAEYAFNTLYNNIIKAHIPERKVEIRSNSLPWITSTIRKSMNKQYKLLQQAKRTQSEDLWRKYRKTRNEVTRQIRSNSLPWITSAIRKSMNKRYKLLQQAKRTQSEDLWRKYRKTRNEVTRQLRTAEALYWKNEFGKTKNSRDFWNLVKKVKRQECKQNTIALSKMIKATLS